MGSSLLSKERGTAWTGNYLTVLMAAVALFFLVERNPVPPLARVAILAASAVLFNAMGRLRERSSAAAAFAALERQAQERARSAADWKRTVEATLSRIRHDLVTPLNVVSGFLELLEVGQGGPLTEKQRIYLDNMRSGVVKLAAGIEAINSRLSTPEEQEYS